MPAGLSTAFFLVSAILFLLAAWPGLQYSGSLLALGGAFLSAGHVVG
jgi:hypothetical protein